VIGTTNSASQPFHIGIFHIATIYNLETQTEIIKLLQLAT